MSSDQNKLAFEKVFKKSTNDVKLTANTMISNEYPFCCMKLDTTIIENESIIYPPDKMNYDYLKNLFSVELKSKPLPQKALDEMKKKGIEPKKQPIDLLLFIIIPTENNILIGINCPSEINFSIDDYVERTIEPYGNINNSMNKSCNKENYCLFEFHHDSPFKEAEVVLQNTFNELKRVGLYKDPDDEEIPLYDF